MHTMVMCVWKRERERERERLSYRATHKFHRLLRNWTWYTTSSMEFAGRDGTYLGNWSDRWPVVWGHSLRRHCGWSRGRTVRPLSAAFRARCGRDTWALWWRRPAEHSTSTAGSPRESSAEIGRKQKGVGLEMWCGSLLRARGSSCIGIVCTTKGSDDVILAWRDGAWFALLIRLCSELWQFVCKCTGAARLCFWNLMNLGFVFHEVTWIPEAIFSLSL